MRTSRSASTRKDGHSIEPQSAAVKPLFMSSSQLRITWGASRLWMERSSFLGLSALISGPATGDSWIAPVGTRYPKTGASTQAVRSISIKAIFEDAVSELLLQ